MGRDRSQISRGVHVDELISTKTLKADVAALKKKVNSMSTTSGSTTLTGVPQPRTPYLVASRTNDDGKVIATVGFTSIPSLGRKFVTTHRLVKNDGTYNEPVRREHKITAAMIVSNNAEIELDHPWHANRRVDLVHVEVKLTSDATDDGGYYDENPKPYVETTSPGTVLASFSTGSTQAGPQVRNKIRNSRFKFSRNGWGDDAADPTHLAKWSYRTPGGFGGDLSSVALRIGNDPALAANYWAKNPGAGSGAIPSRCLVMRSAVSTLDPCARLKNTPWDPGEPFHVQFAMLFRGLGSLGDSIPGLLVTLEDTVAGVIASTQYDQIILSGAANQWTFVRMPETTVLSTYVPGAGKQWVCFHLTASYPARSLCIDKVSASKMPGSHDEHPEDETVNEDGSDAGGDDGSLGRGTTGYGRTGGETLVGTTGQVIRVPLE